MEIKLLLNEENIAHIIQYLNTHPHETKRLIQTFSDKLFDTLLDPTMVKKLSGFYKAMNKEINRKYWDSERP